ncbi:hypothetical protein U9M48_032103 [Paspalum notatum var. saurae]|uniref:Uncharacterized protein n=1 Tax=Paspalum notatum var. saurae TaxID=547442 RepID=A0AAQ3X4F4_PASNO
MEDVSAWHADKQRGILSEISLQSAQGDNPKAEQAGNNFQFKCAKCRGAGLEAAVENEVPREDKAFCMAYGS